MEGLEIVKVVKVVKVSLHDSMQGYGHETDWSFGKDEVDLKV